MLTLVPVIGFFGYSNSGKTTVVAKLVKILTTRGYRVAAIKHAAHGYDMDVPGKDSWQHFRAGAETVVLVGPDSMTMHKRTRTESGLVEAVEMIKNDPDIELILVEGFKSQPGPKIQILRGEGYTDEDIDQQAIAVVCDGPLPIAPPCFYSHNLDPLADFIVAHFLEEAINMAKQR